MHIPNLLAKKRDGLALAQDEIEWFIQHLHEIPNEQIGAFLMACQINGLDAQETTSPKPCLSKEIAYHYVILQSTNIPQEALATR